LRRRFAEQFADFTGRTYIGDTGASYSENSDIRVNIDIDLIVEGVEGAITGSSTVRVTPILYADDLPNSK